MWSSTIKRRKYPQAGDRGVGWGQGETRRTPASLSLWGRQNGWLGLSFFLSFVCDFGHVEGAALFGAVPFLSSFPLWTRQTLFFTKLLTKPPLLSLSLICPLIRVGFTSGLRILYAGSPSVIIHIAYFFSLLPRHYFYFCEMICRIHSIKHVTITLILM